MRQVYGQDRLAAVLSGVAPATRARYVTAWNHWGKFMQGRQLSPRIWRTSPDWGDNLIDYIAFESEILANAPNTISGEISGIRFWNLLVGMPDFTLGGGRYNQVLKSVRRNGRVNRKIPAVLEIMWEIESQQRPDNPKSIGVACAALVGFFLLLRVGELEGLRWADVSLSIDKDGSACLQLTLPRSQTDQYNDGHVKVLTIANRPYIQFVVLLDGWAPNRRVVQRAEP